jgi:class 3 adenylate cyclase
MQYPVQFLTHVMAPNGQVGEPYSWEYLLSAMQELTSSEPSPEVESVPLAALRFEGRFNLTTTSGRPHRLSPEDMVKSLAIQALGKWGRTAHLAEIQQIESMARSPGLASVARATAQRLQRSAMANGATRTASDAGIEVGDKSYGYAKVAIPSKREAAMSDTVVDKVIVVIDLSRYSDICRQLEQQLDVTAVAALNRQIKRLIDLALADAGILSDGLPYKGTGDGAIIALDTAEQGSAFAEKLHHQAARHNQGKGIELAQRHFRVGVWSGKIVLERQTWGKGQPASFEFAGTAIANAVRLESGCNTGEVLISSDTWVSLPPIARGLYGCEEIVKGKRSEEFPAHRRRVTDPAPWEAVRAATDGKRAEHPPAPPTELIDVHKRRLDILQKQAAMYGSLTPPQITMEIEDIKRIISQLES